MNEFQNVVKWKKPDLKGNIYDNIYDMIAFIWNVHMCEIAKFV